MLCNVCEAMTGTKKLNVNLMLATRTSVSDMTTRLKEHAVPTLADEQCSYKLDLLFVEFRMLRRFAPSLRHTIKSVVCLSERIQIATCQAADRCHRRAIIGKLSHDVVVSRICQHAEYRSHDAAAASPYSMEVRGYLLMGRVWVWV